MQALQNIFKRTLAALSFFTRLPFWRMASLERRHYERVVPLWGLAGWLTGGAMAAVFTAAAACGLSAGTGVALALTCRVLLTGALHEDGFADFCDGFGGGTGRQRTLEIMKDSHIGTYGVVGLALYFLLTWNSMTEVFRGGLSPLMFVAADAACKCLSSTIVWFLPYARKETEAKTRMAYARTPAGEKLASLAIGLLPMALLTAGEPRLALCLVAPALCCLLLFALMHRRIQGYTGDCCGAVFIITESVFYLSLCIILSPGCTR
ncbi:MAG: adenosylcobinamide-GDP ribazoletransferase [Prevotella sp.]|nr:adenosylcobinamide-GDP ribazoletransferase [Prevotella sp.]